MVAKKKKVAEEEFQLVDFSKFLLIDVKKLVKADWNYKKEDPDLAKKLVANLKRNGLVENLIVRELETGYYEVMDGNHRLDALIELGAKKAIVYNKGKISKEDAFRMTFETNESKFVADSVKQAGLMKQLLTKYGAEELQETMPYSKERIEDLAKLADFTFDEFENPEDDGSATVTDAGEAVKITFVMDSQTSELWQDWQARCNKVSRGVDENQALLFALSQLKVISDEDLIFKEVEEAA